MTEDIVLNPARRFVIIVETLKTIEICNPYWAILTEYSLSLEEINAQQWDGKWVNDDDDVMDAQILTKILDYKGAHYFSTCTKYITILFLYLKNILLNS